MKDTYDFTIDTTPMDIAIKEITSKRDTMISSLNAIQKDLSMLSSSPQGEILAKAIELLSEYNPHLEDSLLLIDELLKSLEANKDNAQELINSINTTLMKEE